MGTLNNNVKAAIEESARDFELNKEVFTATELHELTKCLNNEEMDKSLNYANEIAKRCHNTNLDIGYEPTGYSDEEDGEAFMGECLTDEEDGVLNCEVTVYCPTAAILLHELAHVLDNEEEIVTGIVREDCHDDEFINKMTILTREYLNFK